MTRGLYDQLNNVMSRIGQFEFEMAKQMSLADQMNTLLAQDRDYSELSLVILQTLPYFQQVIVKCREFIESDEQQYQRQQIFDDLVQLESQCSNRLNLVRRYNRKSSLKRGKRIKIKISGKNFSSFLQDKS